jgi:pimeloyl-ACP methyl ester carboxylesterase
MSDPATPVFVHGGWHDGWSWHLVRQLLDARGVPSVALDLPMTTLAADAAVLGAALAEIDGDAIVVSHSWGGSVATLGAIGARGVRHLKTGYAVVETDAVAAWRALARGPDGERGRGVAALPAHRRGDGRARRGQDHQHRIAGLGVQVNTLLPGYFKTGRQSPAYTDPVVQARIPAGRFGEPEDIVGSVVYLASRASDYVTGHQLIVDGGWYSR